MYLLLAIFVDKDLLASCNIYKQKNHELRFRYKIYLNVLLSHMRGKVMKYIHEASEDEMIYKLILPYLNDIHFKISIEQRINLVYNWYIFAVT